MYVQASLLSCLNLWSVIFKPSILPALSLLLIELIKPAISEWVLIPFLASLLPFLYLIQPVITAFEHAFSSSLHHSCSGLSHLIPHFTQGSKWSLSQPYLPHSTLFFPQLLVFGNALNETYILSFSSPWNLPSHKSCHTAGCLNCFPSVQGLSAATACCPQTQG